MKTFTEILTETKSPRKLNEANAHLTHFEDFLIIEGSNGISSLVAASNDLVNRIQGLESSSNLTLKVDGSMALFAGINKESGNFFVGTKGVLSKEPKLCFSDKDIDSYYSGPVAEILKYALKYTSKLGIKNILQGDVMFIPSNKKKSNVNGEQQILFKPNTITYAVPLNSDLGKEIDRADFGIVWHTSYNNSNGGPIRTMSNSPSPNVDSLKKVSGIWYTNADIQDVSSKVKISSADLSDIKKLTKRLESAKYSTLAFIDSISGADGVKILSFLVHLSKNNISTAETEKLVSISKEFLLKQFSSEKKKKEIEDLIENKEFSKMIELINVAVELKNKILFYLNKLSSLGTFHENSDGELEVVSHEGFVVVSEYGALKLVDRLEFSRLNFAKKR